MPTTQQHLRQLYRAARGFAFHARTPGNLHKAALRAELSGNLENACALWFEQRAALQDVNAPLARVDRSLAACALNSARQAEAAGRWADASQSWEYLRTVEPGSEPAAKGIDRCTQHMAVALDGQEAGILALQAPLKRVPQLWKVDVLLRLGRAREASDHLVALESSLGDTPVSRKLRAQIALHSGHFMEAANAARDSIALSRQMGQRPLSECLLIWAEALGDQDLFAEAREVLCAHMRDPDILTEREFAALFATARNRDDLEIVRAFLEPNFAAGHKSRSGALKQYGIALRDLGFAAEAQDIGRTRLLEELAKPFGHAPRPANGAWAEGAQRALLDLKTDLDASGVPFFLISGTLLGCVREGHLLKHDKDIDVGIAVDIDIAVMRAHLRRTGRFRIRPLKAQSMVRAIHANGTSIDLFVHWLEDGQMIHQGQKARWTNTPFTLKPCPFLGTTFLVPSDPELYLAENYGDWKTPAKDFDTVVDTPNMAVTDREHFIWYCYNTLLNYHASGSIGRFMRLWAALERTAPPDADTSSRIREKIAARNGSEKGSPP